jgi:hypothetical protein
MNAGFNEKMNSLMNELISACRIWTRRPRAARRRDTHTAHQQTNEKRRHIKK